MSRLLSIPREALAELLQAAGSSLTPEQYLASLPETTTYARFESRARAALWSKYIMLVVAVVGVLLLPAIIGLSGSLGASSVASTIENVVIVIGLVALTAVEFRVHRLFRERNPEAPGLGFRNQFIFATAILIYGLYHAWRAASIALPPGFDTSDSPVPIDAGSIQTFVQTFYLLIGLVGFVSQFGLAWYYRGAKVSPVN